MMRLSVAMALAPLPALAWDFTPVPVCTLSHDGSASSLRVTYDPGQTEPYAIAITRDAAWPAEAIFAMRFDGPRGMTITTDRHRMSPDGRTLTVTDRGFGNVLNGLEFNVTATALAGDTSVAFPLDGAAPEVQAFRACTDAPAV